jgi:tRNA(Ser,Leu) C12 N-acetylase TAN1
LTYRYPSLIIGQTVISQGTKALARKDELAPIDEEATPDIEQIIKRLDMLDRRLDNVDSVVSAVAERVMKQPITFNVTCSKCGQKIEIAIIGNEKPSR